MKTKEKFPLTTFIKNVQSTLRKVGEFALNNIEYVLVVTGIAAKIYETLIAEQKRIQAEYNQAVGEAREYLEDSLRAATEAANEAAK